MISDAQHGAINTKTILIKCFLRFSLEKSNCRNKCKVYRHTLNGDFVLEIVY